MSALAEYDREINKKSGKQPAALNSVESRVAKDKAYKEYLEEHLGSAIPSIRIYQPMPTSYFKRREELKIKSSQQDHIPDRYIKSIDLRPDHLKPKESDDDKDMKSKSYLDDLPYFQLPVDRVNDLDRQII